MMDARRIGVRFLLAAAALTAGACTGVVVGAPGPGGGYGHGAEYYGPRDLGIPPGHLPPPGSCRIWYPGTPPGHQPPPGDCAALSHQVPPGAWLIVRPPHEPRHARVRFYDRQRAGVVIGISIYDADSGRRIATERPDEKRGEAGKTRPGG